MPQKAIKPAHSAGFQVFLAEREGFEPPVPLGTLVFKTSAFDHSAISPVENSKTLRVGGKFKQDLMLCKGKYAIIFGE